MTHGKKVRVESLRNTFSDEYWDCACEVDYIRPNDQLSCPKCGESRRTSPRSLVKEVRLMRAAEAAKKREEDKAALSKYNYDRAERIRLRDRERSRRKRAEKKAAEEARFRAEQAAQKLLRQQAKNANDASKTKRTEGSES